VKRYLRLRILAAIVLLLFATAAVVLLASPYAPVVEGYKEIEEIWAIEDAREESETPLVTKLFNHGMEIGYDQIENTFYCPVSLDYKESWPEIHLTAPDAKGVSICFVDDYTYDFCADALWDSRMYEILVYTDTHYSYAYMVFTGLPQVILESEQELLPHEDVPVSFAMTTAEGECIETYARAHERGDTSLRATPKHGVKVEFTRKADGRKKTQVQMPLLGTTDEFILLSGSMDDQLIRDFLSWKLYGGISQESETMGSRDVHYVEMFVNDRYQGVFLIMKPYDYADEMAKAGMLAPERDSLYRLAGRSVYEFDKPLAQDHRNIYYEQHYGPEGTEPFAPLAAYLDLFAEEDDALFCEKAEKYLDLDSVIRYALLVQACGMTDNEKNNLYIWANMTEGGPVYRFSPWDMDSSFGKNDEENSEVWYEFELFDRLLELDCGGARSRLAAIWKQMRETAFSDENLTGLIEEYTRLMNDTGAFYRDALRWSKDYTYADAYNIQAYVMARMQMMDRRIAEITDESLAGHRLRIQGYTTFDKGML